MNDCITEIFLDRGIEKIIATQENKITKTRIMFVYSEYRSI